MSFSSPYNFVPVNPSVHFPREQNLNHDAPLENGLSGELEIAVSNLSPIIIGDELKSGQKSQPFFKTPDGVPAMPGTSLKGYLRTLIEAATASYITLQDNLFSERDLTSAKNDYMARLKAKKPGWLIWDESNDSWMILPAKGGYKTIRHTADVTHNQKNANTDVSEVLSDALPKLSKPIHKIEKAKERYETIHQSYSNKPKIGPAIEVLPSKYLVVTNQLEGCSKRREFLFGAPDFDKSFIVPSDVYRKFIYVMDESQTEVGAEHWSYLKAFAKEGIPVFYLKEGAQISSFGLASLYRLPYDKTIYDLLPEQQKKKNLTEKIDFACRMFGEVPIKSNSFFSRKGRVSVSLLKAKQNNFQFETVKLLLSNPKPSYYPAYLEQQKGALKNYSQASLIRGFKQYLPHKTIKQSIFPKKSNGEENLDVSKQVEALSPNNTFTGKIRFHNLLPQELGALIWAITLGEDINSSYVHLLGMGKPLGYGKCKIEINQLHATSLDGQSAPKSISAYLKDFYAYLASEELLNNLSLLKASHREGVVPDNQLNYLRLDPKAKKDEFLDVRKQKRSLGPIDDSPEREQLNQVAQDVSGQVAALKLEIQKEAERKLAEKQAQELAEQQARELAEQEQRRQNRSPYEVLFEDTLNGEITKKTLETLAEKPELWQTLSPEDQIGLAKKIKLSDWFKQNKRKKLKDKFPSLLPLVDLVL